MRLYLSSQWDMSAERRALIELAVPALKRFCDDRRGVSFAVYGGSFLHSGYTTPAPDVPCHVIATGA